MTNKPATEEMPDEIYIMPPIFRSKLNGNLSGTYDTMPEQKYSEGSVRYIRADLAKALDASETVAQYIPCPCREQNKELMNMVLSEILKRTHVLDPDKNSNPMLIKGFEECKDAVVLILQDVAEKIGTGRLKGAGE